MVTAVAKRTIKIGSIVFLTLLLGTIFTNRPLAQAAPGHPPILWTNPDDIQSRNLHFGIGGPNKAPDASATFTVTTLAGSDNSEKVVSDETGRSWFMIHGPQAKAEVAASKLLWAVGFRTDEDYYVPVLHVIGPHGGDFRDVRLKLRETSVHSLGSWHWSNHPFTGTLSMQGFKLMLAIINAYNISDSNNVIVRDDDRPENFYYRNSLACSLGRLKNSGPTTTGIAKDYASSPIILGTSHGQLVFPKMGARPMLNGVTLDGADWTVGLLSRLSPDQIASAFSTSGFSNVETGIYAAAIIQRIKKLKEAVSHQG